MTDKQIIDYCENYSKEIGCRNTFDGSCSKEECFTYRLLQLLQAKEQECEELKHKVELMMDCASCKVDEYKKTLAEIKEIAKKSMHKGKMLSGGWLYQFIEQKISEAK